MKHKNVKRTMARAVTACIALGSLPAFAQNFNPPGYHTWYLTATPNSVHVYDSSGGAYLYYISGVPELRYGRDFLIGGKGTNNFTSYKIGYIPIAVGPAIYSCNLTSCAVSVNYTTSSCTAQQTTYGITAKADVPVLNALSFSATSANTYQACSSNADTATGSVGKGSIASDKKALAILAIGYKDSNTYHTSNKIYWSPGIKSSSNDQNSTLWTRVYNVCKKLGWAAPTTHWSSARDVVKKTGFCYLGTSKSVTGLVYGPQPFERIATFPIISETSTRSVGTFYYSSSW